jgi:hypothetical protein
MSLFSLTLSNRVYKFCDQSNHKMAWQRVEGEGWLYSAFPTLRLSLSEAQNMRVSHWDKAVHI